MSKKKYIVQRVEGYHGLEFLSDSPVGRRTYLPGEEVELDDKVHDIVGLLGSGIVVKASAVKAEGPAEADNKDKEE